MADHMRTELVLDALAVASPGHAWSPTRVTGADSAGRRNTGLLEFGAAPIG